MKTIGIQIKSNEVVMVVLSKDAQDNICETKESAKFKLDDPFEQIQVKQFRDQVNSFFDSVKADRIGIVARNPNGKGMRAPSPTSFKLEGLMQLYDKINIEIIWKKTTDAFFKKNDKSLSAEKIYQKEAFDLAYYLMIKE
ncbi:hypothetical protein ASG22_09050 [Chryseobacterium sp. Leaf405]|uniref:DUF3010 family protein n=1 Tax=Chryseobacterium sp. Leaf405 TaxID=1736367 RepID=UPI0006FBE98D|nr:DUF3010 family protein [Chryseobacterium sp. Leaf405]KQT24152.1 hypothetical protein ASG22_09050 [Chryseobacterium sp. Leaf405]